MTFVNIAIIQHNIGGNVWTNNSIVVLFKGGGSD